MHVVRKPKLTEVRDMKALIDLEVQRGSVLNRELPELYENARDFYVYADERGLGGCCAMHIDQIDLAEIRTLLVRDDLRGQGIGSQLMRACVHEAQTLDIARIYTLTRVPRFFAANGFAEIHKDELPTKVYKDCLRCPRYHDCDEIAMICDLDTKHTVTR